MKAGVLGSPIRHSLSPVLHQAAYAALGLADWSYERHEVTVDGLAGFLDSCDEQWAGLSLTMPLKVAALHLVEVVEPLAQVVGAVNTIIFAPGSLRVAANTDVHGIVQAIAEAGPRGRERARTGVILGGGATACSALIALGQIGVTDATVVVRSRARAAAVMRAAHAAGLTPNFATFEDPQLLRTLANADVAISTVPAGADSTGHLEWDDGEISQDQVLLDVTYADGFSPLAHRWKLSGGSTVRGEVMLLHQAAEQVRLMTSRTPPIEIMRAALEAQLQIRARGDGAEP